MRGARRAAALLLLGAVAAAHGQSARGASAPALLLKPIAIFSEQLYEGELSEPRGLALDPATGEVWVADSRNHRLSVFTPQGVPLYTSPPSDRVREPARLVVGAHGELLVLDNDRSRIKVLNYRGEYQRDLELPGLGEQPVVGAIARDADGNLYVGENESGQVLVYGPDLRLKLRFGERGDFEGQFQSIAGIAADKDLIAVVDHQVLCVQLFDRRGNFLRGWGKHEMGIQNFSLPEAVALDSKGHVIVVDALRHEVKFFDREGNFLDRFGGLGARAGNTAFPSDVAVDAEDRVYVAERGNNRISVFEQIEQPASR